MSDYSIWMLEYARVPDAAMSSLVYGKHNGGTVELPYCYTLLKGHGQTILLDCGLNNASHGVQFVKRFNVQNWFSPRDVLAEVGCTPEEVTHVILTHAHFDHMGGLELFPNATFYIQEEELASWVSIMSMDRRFRWLLTAVDTGDMIYAVQLAREGRMRGLKGDIDDLFPGVDVRLAKDTHTAASQYIVIRNDGKRDSEDVFVYTGDLVYRHDNLHGGNPADPFYLPVGLASGSQTNLLMTTDAILKAVGDDMSRVLAPHEPSIASLYPSRVTKNGHQLVEVALGAGQQSYVR
ncbi:MULTISPECIES: N-acyl homoserine lactonase family protein [Pseudomonas]|uniref:N-acyl homoserine lactonase family protein n=1 Tax=Pseudomonas TaxID=286 RepID=UPI0009538AF4|nr:MULTISPECIES: N-acyl homoserine lactonase family protein [Pseudomonas]WLG65390.1 N-acyl homoserine lactonase family protein [Pseudomonas brassicacearum]SIS02101.1 Glyoxylase, beta-lactamase superfamily II [Pseudomonas sp. A214]